MKRFIALFLACVTAAAISVAAIACSGGDESSDSVKRPSQSDSWSWDNDNLSK